MLNVFTLLSHFNSSDLQQLVDKALNQNFTLQQLALTVALREQDVTITDAARWPTLDLSFDPSRRKSLDPTRYQSSFSLDLNLRYELDIWGKLSDSTRQQYLTWQAEKANYLQAQQQLAADVVIAWYNIIEAQQLLALMEKRVAVAQQNLDIIESGYRQGLNESLDVYLTRNELNTELSRKADQVATQQTAIRTLERLLGDYPAGLLAVEQSLPLITDDIPLGMPAELLSRKPQLLQRWHQLLAADASVALAHKQRFPSFTLTGSVGRSSSELNELISGEAIGWSLLGSLTTPLFNAGELKAREEKARITLKQTEQQYLDTLYQAFADVENGITREASLKARYQATMKAEENAVIAEKLSFEQYLKGLVSYTTVLDAQQRAFDAQSNLIQIKNQLIANRVRLHLALGGDFAVTPGTSS